MNVERIKSFFLKCVRVWHILRKPTSEEFKTVSKIASLGIIAIGLMGFVIALIVGVFYL